MSWWRGAVFYQVYIRSFADGNGDGVGDLPGLRSKLGYLEWLGVDAIWITPFYPSPMADHGYDVADFRGVDPLFGTLGDFDALLSDAHRAGMRVVVDIVPNHTSNRHPWFVEALSGGDGSARDLYIFREPKPDGSPPNNWGSVFGGPAWTLDEPSGRYYLHLFASEQPDLNWRDPRVAEDFERTLRFWLDRGVDGFRIDVAHGLFKDERLRDNPESSYRQAGATAYYSLEQRYNFDQPEVHDVYRAWRKLAESYPGDRVLIGEVFLLDPVRVAPYLRPDELHLAFNFLLMGARWDARHFRETIDRSLDSLAEIGAPCTWVLSNHDLTRHASRYGGGEVGQRRARAAALLLLSLPGAVFVYAGEELGLEEVDVPDEAREDPIFLRTRGAIKGRDGCRVPVPWNADPAGYGFSEAAPWLPMPPGWGKHSVETLRRDAGSVLNLYRAAIAARASFEPLTQGSFRWLDAPEGCLAFERGAPGGSGGERAKRADPLSVVSACNFGPRTEALAVAGEIALASNAAVKVETGRLVLPPDSAAWVS